MPEPYLLCFWLGLFIGLAPLIILLFILPRPDKRAPYATTQTEDAGELGMRRLRHETRLSNLD